MPLKPAIGSFFLLKLFNSNKELTHFINDNAKIEEKNKVSLNSKKNNNTNNNIRKLFC